MDLDRIQTRRAYIDAESRKVIAERKDLEAAIQAATKRRQFSETGNQDLAALKERYAENGRKLDTLQRYDEQTRSELAPALQQEYDDGLRQAVEGVIVQRVSK